ncbi:biotin synthase BioB [Leptospira licerasiae]|uniref:Biotin synthase n=1 Tax=Leptospira licerasiae str. MMD4847 TaxID=1049971 RepID=A0ABN0HBU8_9LEPT|nr:biotin synthase BioB [Leptospira licerasiae]EIE01569.1 biotin synthase [Leptospira licerasiae serovar Varillal str. VAR 010]EJZ42985.1 biotin synthase [Leptospira licerasiae str. MMD4847]
MKLSLETPQVTEEKIFSEVPSIIDREETHAILSGQIPLTEALDKAYKVREKYFGKTVRIHVLDNIKNGHCPEDCGYCAQRKNADSGVQEYSMKSPEEIFQDAAQAKENGAYRFCMVTAGTGPNSLTTEKLAFTIEKISKELGLKVCLSAGLLDREKAERLKAAGLDRYNHNLNTSKAHYPEICDTHTYEQRVETITHLMKAGVGMCSGVIVGMGESLWDLTDVIYEIKNLKVISIPVNFFIPVAGHAIKNPQSLTPEFCLRTLIAFRLVNPDSEVRIAAGREGHLRGLQGMALYAANSLFASGYLNVKGSDAADTIRMILDSGFYPEFSSGVGEEIDWESALGKDHPYARENFPELYKYRKSLK